MLNAILKWTQVYSNWFENANIGSHYESISQLVGFEIKFKQQAVKI